jgi:hypothetical protein
MNKKKMLREFEQAFSVYVRMTDGEATDSRPDTSSKLLAQPVETIIALMGDAPHDLAAILSGVVTVEGEKLVAKPNSGAAADFLAELDKSEAGQELAAKIATCLSWARKQPGIKHLI